MNFNPVILATYGAQLGSILSLAIANASENKAEASAKDNRKGGLVDALRDYVTVTHGDKVETESAAIALRIMLSNATGDDGKPLVPGGTVKNYVSAFKGFRKILERGESIADKSTTQANDEMASEEQKLKKAAKAAFAKLTKDWTAAQWQQVVDSFTAPAVAESSDDEVSDEEEAELEAAAA